MDQDLSKVELQKGEEQFVGGKTTQEIAEQAAADERAAAAQAQPSDSVPVDVPVSVVGVDRPDRGLPMCGDQGCVFTQGHQGPHSHYYTTPEGQRLA